MARSARRAQRLFALRVDVVGLAVDRDRLALEREHAGVARAVPGDDRAIAGTGHAGTEARSLRDERGREVAFPHALLVAELQVHVRVAEADRLNRAGQPALLVFGPGPAVM